MSFSLHIEIVDLIVKGILIGIIVSAPMGPVGVLCVQRTLNKGRWFGFFTGIGAVLSDTIYAIITFFGMIPVMNFINFQHNKYYLQIAGSLVLMIFGVYTYRSDPTKRLRKPNYNKGSLLYNCSTAFLVTFSNPLIILLFIACYAQFAFVIPNHPSEMIISFMCIIIGALLWWFGLTWLLNKIRGRFDNNGIKIINQIIGAIVVICSAVILFATIADLYCFPNRIFPWSSLESYLCIPLFKGFF